MQEGYTNPSKLAIYGRSAGGLLIGGVLNMRNDLFSAALMEVPFVDTLNTMLNPDIPWTTFEYEEWGNPNESDIFTAMHGYCPYTNIAARKYPHMLIMAGMNDPRVSYFEPAKYTAKLREYKAIYSKKVEEGKHAFQSHVPSNSNTLRQAVPPPMMQNPSQLGLRGLQNASAPFTPQAIPDNEVEHQQHDTLLMLKTEDVGHSGPGGQYAALEVFSFFSLIPMKSTLTDEIRAWLSNTPF